jgi:hypothetical protein
MNEYEMCIPIRPQQMAKIRDMVVGEKDIDIGRIKWLRNIRADNDVTCQIHMESGESHYIRGKDMYQVAAELGIQLRGYTV